MSDLKIYLDSNAAAPLDPMVVEELRRFSFALPCGEQWILPNPSSLHHFGRYGRRLVEQARERVADTLNVRLAPEQLFFTASGSEANQAAVRSSLWPSVVEKKSFHWILSAAEHDSTLQARNWVESLGGSLSVLGLNPDGQPNWDELPNLVREDTKLLSCVAVGGETGVITEKLPIEFLKEKKIEIHIDAAQAWGKIPLDFERLGTDYLTLSGHKIGAPAGVGAVIHNKNKRIYSAVSGKQEWGKRGGTENVLGIHLMGVAAQSVDPASYEVKLSEIRNTFESLVKERFLDTKIFGSEAHRVANTSQLSLGKGLSQDWVIALDLEGIAISAGSACASGVVEPSAVLLAMGVEEETAKTAFRISFPKGTQKDVLPHLLNTLEKCYNRF